MSKIKRASKKRPVFIQGAIIKHRANSIHAGLDQNYNMVNLKHKGEWNHNSIQNLLAYLLSAVPDIAYDLAEAKRMAGKHHD